jgi:hypothetical protein
MSNNDTPQWQLNLLARFPRPAALLLIVIIDWFINDGIVWTFILAWLTLPPLIAYLSTGDVFFTVAVVVGDALSGLVTLYVLGWLLDRYDAYNKKLPRREKKPNEPGGKEPA